MMKLLSCSLCSCLLISSFSSTQCLAIEPMDQYYADDLIEAVDQAREQPHHYDYSGTYRYKRTTAQSIELNRLDLNELDNTRLEMQADQTEDKNAQHFSENGQSNEPILEDSSSKLTSLRSNDPLLDISGPTLPQNGYHKASRGEYRTTNIQSNGIVISTPRP